MATMEIDLKDRLAEIYYQFMTDMHIDTNTGIVYCKNKHAKKNKPWKFATMPYIGQYYGYAKPKILFIGLDLGKDIKRGEHEYLMLDDRHDTILGIDKNKKQKPDFDYNPHIAGTYAASLAFLREYNEKWDSEWKELFKHYTNKDKKTTKTLVNKYRQKPSEDEKENNVLEYVGLTNLFKFVTVDRKNAQGDENRHWIDKETELNLLKAEITTFDPDIIILQGSRRYLYKKKNEDEKIFNFFEFCKQNGIIVIKGKHPAYPKDGWNKINGVINLLEMYEKQIKKVNKKH